MDRAVQLNAGVYLFNFIAPLVFQSGMQTTSSPTPGFNEIPATVLTSTDCDLMGDFKIFELNNVKRNTRIAAVMLFLTAATSSGWLMRSSGGLISVLWIADRIRLFTVMGIMLLCWLQR